MLVGNCVIVIRIILAAGDIIFAKIERTFLLVLRRKICISFYILFLLLLCYFF